MRKNIFPRNFHLKEDGKRSKDVYKHFCSSVFLLEIPQKQTSLAFFGFPAHRILFVGRKKNLFFICDFCPIPQSIFLPLFIRRRSRVNSFLVLNFLLLLLKILFQLIFINFSLNHFYLGAMLWNFSIRFFLLFSLIFV